jgi:cell wall-associated NlpC family hydrolase
MTAFDIVDKYLGVAYKDNGRDLTIGLDCWGLIIHVIKDLFSIDFPDLHYKKFGILREYVKSGKSTQPVFLGDKKNILQEYDMSMWVVPIANNPILGDILLLFPIENLAIHAGIYLDKGKFIHSVCENGVVLGEIISWKNQIEGYYRVKPELINKVS